MHIVKSPARVFQMLITRVLVFGLFAAANPTTLPQVLLGTEKFTYSLYSGTQLQSTLPIGNTVPVLYLILPDGKTRRNFVHSDFVSIYGSFLANDNRQGIHDLTPQERKQRGANTYSIREGFPPTYYGISLYARLYIAPTYTRTHEEPFFIDTIPSTYYGQLKNLIASVPLPPWNRDTQDPVSSIAKILPNTPSVKRYYAQKKIQDAKKDDDTSKFIFSDLEYKVSMGGFNLAWFTPEEMTKEYTLIHSFEFYVLLTAYLHNPCFIVVGKGWDGKMLLLDGDKEYKDWSEVRQYVALAKQDLKISQKIPACPIYPASPKEVTLLSDPKVRAELNSDKDVALTGCSEKAGCTQVTSTDYRDGKTLATTYSVDAKQTVASHVAVQPA